MTNVKVNVGPQINCADTVEAIEINDTTNLICNCSKVNIIVFYILVITEPKYENFRSTFLYVSPSALVSELSWTLSSVSALVASVAMLLLEDILYWSDCFSSLSSLQESVR